LLEELDDDAIEHWRTVVRLRYAHHDDRYCYRDSRFSDARGDVLLDGYRTMN
jgi:hypothetical protein